AIGRWLLAAAARRPLLIAIDDLQRVDETSLATLALLSRGLRDAPLAIVATAETGADSSAGSAFRVYDDMAVSVTLEPLDVLETRSLLGSVFGEHQNLDLLVHRLFGVSQGYPRDLLRLAQHLVDRQLVRYRAGAWLLPSQIDTSDLPASVAQLLRSRAQALGPAARALARALALCPEHSFDFEECRVLANEAELGPVVNDVGQLIRADIVRTSHEQLTLRDRAWLPVLRDEVDRIEARTIHLRLARVFEQRGNEDFRVAQHLLRADEHDAAVDRLVAHAVSSMAVTDKSPEEFFKLISSLPEDWLETYEAGLELCRALERPKRELYALQARLTGLVAVIGRRDTRHVRTLIADLSAAAGLDDWAALDPRLEPMPRLVQALQTVQARYEAAPDDERTIEPVAAIRALARAFITAVGMSTPLFDLPALRALPSLAPLTPLSPALGVIEELVESVTARLSGRFDRARAHYQVLLERVAAPDRAGFDESHHRYMCIGLYNGMGLLEAVMGLASSLEWADRIEAVDSLFKVNALLVRMLYHLWQGDCAEAERHKSQLAALRIASSARQTFEHTHLVWQLTAHAQLEDLTRLERTRGELAHAVGHHPGWQPVLAYGHAEYQRVRGDPARAVTELERALQRTQAGDHQIWADLAGAHVRALDESGRTAAAVSCGDQYLERAAAKQLDWTYAIRMPLCVARAKLGDERAAAEADAIIASLVERGTTGLMLSLAYEARARVALGLSDGAAYQEYHGLLARDAQRTASTALSVKAQKLRREAQRRQLASIAPPAAQLSRRAVTTTLLQQELAVCSDPVERARLALALLAEHSGVIDGCLYQMRAEGLVWVASLDGRQPDAALDAMVREYVAAEIHSDELTTGSGSAAGASTEWSSLGEASFRPVLLCHYVQAGYAVSGVAVFALRLGARFVYPIELASRISRSQVEAGDAVSVIVKAR
ncbi:MAG TPA: hypothetical protein VJR89_06685, partial [Polyangiales bacterium]|nr:hypothetical protein [Polyangiales bacterium]